MYMKTVLFVPGYQEDINTRDYRSTIAAIESTGYKVMFVPINWSRTTIEQWVAELDDIYRLYDPADTVLAGFSFGAMTAFVSAANRNPSELWLFSLSPYFAEDMDGMKQSWLTRIGHRRVTTFKKLNFQALAKTVDCKTILFVGAAEITKYPTLGERAYTAAKLLTNSVVVAIDEVGHDVADIKYIKAIQNTIAPQA
jgi:predicted alpha/beta hydrolase family esterase